MSHLRLKSSKPLCANSNESVHVKKKFKICVGIADKITSIQFRVENGSKIKETAQVLSVKDIGGLKSAKVSDIFGNF